MMYKTIINYYQNITIKPPRTFTGKERDSETGFSYFGARYYDSDILTGWLSVDPMADKYPGLSPYAYCAWNPVKLVDPDGEDPFTAILEGVTAFGMSAGVDFVDNFLIKGMSAKDAFTNINWGSATLDAVTTAGLSFFVSGTGSARAMAKIAKSKGGKMVTEIVQNMVTSISEKFESGKYNSIDEINWIEDFSTAAVSTFVNNGLNSRADELIDMIGKSDKLLANSLAKQKRNIEAQKNSVRLERDFNQVKISRKNRNSAIREYQKNKAYSKVNERIVDEVFKEGE
ncbi:MAG: RHS repeat-associated core domain-containing protein [Bacteroidales bacterium]|nr:RHS repeat-associated core domain-containing protein [Bacteroidales bacterium]